MRLLEHPGALSVVRLPVESATPRWAFEQPDGHDAPALASITRTADELSVVCASANVPEQLPGPVQGPFVAFEVAGPLDFALTGVLAGLLKPLADVEVSVFATSTHDTDWVLVPVASIPSARAAWSAAGHQLGSWPDDAEPHPSSPSSSSPSHPSSPSSEEQ